MGKMDLHCHSAFSTDGEYSIDALVERAKRKGLGYFSITDHNNIAPIYKYLLKKNVNTKNAYHDLGKMLFLPGVEVTCRINERVAKNLKGNPSKVHLLVYSPLLSGNTMFSDLIDLKRTNDISFDFGALMQMAELKDIELEENDIRHFIRERRDLENGFSSFSKNDIYDYFKSKYKDAFSSKRNFDHAYEDIKQSARLNLSAKDVIDFAHETGGIVVMAHPKSNMVRMVDPYKALDCLLDYGLDGFEMVCPPMDKKSADIIEKVIKRHDAKNPIIYTCGSDYHRKVGWRDLGTFRKEEKDEMVQLNSSDATNFEKEINRLQRAREEKCLTHRRYESISHAELSDKLDKIRDFVKKNKRVESFAIFGDAKDKPMPEFDKEIMGD